MAIRSFAATHVGRRPNNEDAYRVDMDLGLFLVADGMGGYEGGEIASAVGVDAVHAYFSRIEDGTDPGFDHAYSDAESVAENRMGIAFRLADREVSSRRRGRLAQMGSTLVALLVRGERALVAHVGDSRVYRLRRGVLKQLTMDHSLYEELVRAAAADRPAPHGYVRSSVITRALGVPGRAVPEVTTVSVKAGDRFLLATDGLTDTLPPGRIRDTLGRLPPEEAVDILVTDAYYAGSADNITAVVVAVD